MLESFVRVRQIRFGESMRTMPSHFQSSWVHNRGNLLLVLGSIAGLIMCLLWYFQLLPDFRFVTPRTEIGVPPLRRAALDPLVVVVNGPVRGKNEAGEATQFHGYVELFAAQGTLAADQSPLHSTAFELRAPQAVPVILNGVNPGEYAALAYLDLNDNGKLDFDASLLPSEPYRLSNSPTAASNSIDLSEAAFEISVGQIMLLEFDFRSRRR